MTMKEESWPPPPGPPISRKGMLRRIREVLFGPEPVDPRDMVIKYGAPFSTRGPNEQDYRVPKCNPSPPRRWDHEEQRWDPGEQHF